jgi:CheY-like chemotaxis protein
MLTADVARGGPWVTMSAGDVEPSAGVQALLRDALDAADGLAASELTPEQRASVERVRESVRRAATALGHPGAAPAPAPREAAAPRGAPRVLLVEDNVVNQRVAQALLTKRGYLVAVAADGREAVEATRGATFDAVLMDCHMPRMDGYQATAVIRDAEGAGARLPIIAMTANAGAGARERCLAAGMDDFVAKPVSADALDMVLQRWVKRTSTPPSTSARPSSPPIDLGMLRRLRGGPDPLGADIVSEVIAIFQADAPLRLAELREAVTRGDLAAAARAAHTLRGSASHLGAKTLGGICGRFEDKVRAGKVFDAVAAVAAIADALDRVQTALASEPRSTARAFGPASSRRA